MRLINSSPLFICINIQILVPYTLMLLVFHWLKAWSNSVSVSCFNTTEHLLISFLLDYLTQNVPLSTDFTFKKRKKSHGVKSDKYEGEVPSVVMCLSAKNCLIKVLCEQTHFLIKN